MSRFLNVGIMQNGNSDPEFGVQMKRIENDVEFLMSGMIKPDIIVGTEYGIGGYWEENGIDDAGDIIPGVITGKLSAIAKKHEVYLLPGSMVEKQIDENGNITRYNAMPIFGPNGEIIDVYRKICPFYPCEPMITPGDRYVVFDCKGVKVGVQICHDWCFPEISRNLALMGAEVLVKPSVDPELMQSACKNIAPTRALENQAFFIAVNWAGTYFGGKQYGNSVVVRPDASIQYELGETPSNVTVTIDLDEVRNARKYGTNFSDQYLRQLAVFNPPQPYANKYGEAPIVKDLPPADITCEERKEKFEKDGITA